MDRSTDYSGAEVEHAISDAMFLAVYNDGVINTSYILEALRNIKPNSGFLGESFKKMVQQFNYIGVIEIEVDSQWEGRNMYIEVQIQK